MNTAQFHVLLNSLFKVLFNFPSLTCSRSNRRQSRSRWRIHDNRTTNTCKLACRMYHIWCLQNVRILGPLPLSLTHSGNLSAERRKKRHVPECQWSNNGYGMVCYVCTSSQSTVSELGVCRLQPSPEIQPRYCTWICSLINRRPIPKERKKMQYLRNRTSDGKGEVFSLNNNICVQQRNDQGIAVTTPRVE